MSLEFSNIETSQIYTLHFQDRKFYEIKYDKSLGRAEILCGKLGPSNTKITSRLQALYKEIQGEEEVKNFMRECIKKKLTKGYQFLDPPKVPKLPNPNNISEITSTSILGKRSGQTINEIEPDLTKKLNRHSNDTLQSSQEPSSRPSSPSQNSEKSSIIQSKKFLELTPEKKEKREKKLPKLEVIEKYTRQMNKPKKYRVMGVLNFANNPNNPDFRIEYQEASESSSEISEEIDEDSDDDLEEVQNEKALTEKEFLKKVNSLESSESRFGDPIFNAHELLTLPSEWKDEYPIGWYMNKMREGIRCMWSGFEMLTENGSVINLPEFFIEALPKSPLDGELCMENRVFTMEEYQVIQCLGSEDEDYERIWNDMMFVVYDSPGILGSFEQRLEKLKEYFEDPGLLYVRLEDYKKCRGKFHAESELEKVLKENGKGIKLADPLGEYEKGVTKNVLVKTKSRRS